MKSTKKMIDDDRYVPYQLGGECGGEWILFDRRYECLRCVDGMTFTSEAQVLDWMRHADAQDFELKQRRKIWSRIDWGCGNGQAPAPRPDAEPESEPDPESEPLLWGDASAGDAEKDED